MTPLRLFPALCEEELFYSAASRYSAITNYRNPRYVLADLFGGDGPGNATLDLPSRLGDFIDRLPHPAAYSPAEIIYRHTQLPYYSRFVDAAKLNRIEAMMTGHPGRSVSFALGLHTSRVIVPRSLRFCPACITDDIGTAGAPFWHRVHQLPGVFVCPTHRCALRELPAERSLRVRPRKFQPLDESAIADGRRLVVPGSLANTLQSLAENSLWLLANPGACPTLTDPIHRLIRLLRTSPWMMPSGAVRLTALATDLRGRAGDRLLRHIGCPLDSADPHSSWLRKICSTSLGGRKFLHPLHFLLVLDLLETKIGAFFSLDLTEPEASFASELPPASVARSSHSDGPCANPLCDHFALHPGSRAHAIPPGTRPCVVHCRPCGFTYQVARSARWQWHILQTGPVWNAELARLGANENLTFRAIGARLGVDVATVQRHMFRLGIARSGWSISCRLKPKGHDRRHDVALKRNRQIWLEGLKIRPPLTQRQLIQKAKSSYNFLVRNDPEWLKSHSSSHQRAEYLRTLWKKRDHTLMTKAKRAVASMRLEREKPRRITAARISRAVVGSTISGQMAATSPQFTEYLRRSRESTPAFARRRLAWAIDQFSPTDPIPTFAQLTEMMGLRKAATTSIEPEIRAALAKRHSGR